MDRVRGVLPGLDGEFTLHDVQRELERKYPGQEITNLSSAMKRLSEREEIICVEAGKGRRPSIFRMPG